MLTGKPLGDAIKAAIDKKIAKGVTKKMIADNFGIREPSIADWIKKGSIGKERLPQLWNYFSDVADMAHWGLSADDFRCFGLVPAHQVRETPAEYQSIRSRRINALLEAIAPISDTGIEHLTSYAQWVAGQYPKDKANKAS